jgi:predicted nucleic acid-binding protein
MIVVSNTSPLTNLAAIEQLDLLRLLYGKVCIPHAVWDELNEGGQRWPGAEQVAAAAWIERHPVRNQDLVVALRRELHRGEAESIALALELHADLLLLDEREGRHAAQHLGLRVVGVVGVLLDAKSHRAIPEIRTFLDGLRDRAGFRLRQSVYEAALAQAGEIATTH